MVYLQIASTRYAQHLSECMGLTGRKRRAPMSRNTSQQGSNTNAGLVVDIDSDDDEEEDITPKRRSQ